MVMDKPYFLIAIPYYLGRLARFCVYISIWTIFVYALYRHFQIINMAFNAEFFLYLTLRVLIDIAVLIIISLMFFLAKPTPKHYTIWMIFGLLAIAILLLFPLYKAIIMTYSSKLFYYIIS